MLTPCGLEVAMMLAGAVDAAASEIVTAQLPCPSLRSGQTVIMDNLSVHKRIRVRSLIEAAGCRLLFLPAYAPDFAPIKQAFAKIKGRLRAAGAGTTVALEAAITRAIDAVTPHDARAFFRHCGYQVAPHA